MTFLELCQAVASESGTISGDGRPTSVSGQSGRLLKIITWVDRAWRDIQNERDDWRWMTKEFSGPLVAGTQRYTATSLGVTSRFRSWRVSGMTDDRGMSVYANSLGQSDQTSLSFVPWPAFARTFLTGSATGGKPSYITVSPADQIVVYPVPIEACTLVGEYQQSPQGLTANTDVPEMPARFHDMIVWRALINLARHDEGVVQEARWQVNYNEMMRQLVREQLPQMYLHYEPLA